MRIYIEENKIKVLKTWPKPQLIKNISVFIDLANIYCYFIKNFNNKIIALLISILKTMAPSTLARSGQMKANENETDTKNDGNIDGGRIDDRIANLLNSTKIKKILERVFLTLRLA